MKFTNTFLLTTWLAPDICSGVQGGLRTFHSQDRAARILRPKNGNDATNVIYSSKKNSGKQLSKEKNTTKATPLPQELSTEIPSNECPADKGGQATTICHKNGNSFQTIKVSKKGAKRHMERHKEDSCGECSFIDPTLCAELGTSCTEPFNGFFQNLAVHGSFSAPGMDEEAFKNWMKVTLWNSLSMETLLEGVPENYIAVSTEVQDPIESSGQLLLDEYFDFLFSAEKLTPYGLLALQGEFDFSFVARRLPEEVNRGLEVTSDEDCKRLLTANVAQALVLCLEAAGIDNLIGQQIVEPLIQTHVAEMGDAFATQFVQQNGLTEGFIASVLIVFVTRIFWSEFEEIAKQEFSGLALARALLQISTSLMKLFTSGGWTAVAKLEAAMPSILSIFDNDMDVFTNDCFGDTIVQGCEDFFQSGGFGLTSSTVNMGQTAGEITLDYEMYSIEDEIEVFYEGERIYWSNGLVSGHHNVNLSYGPGNSQLVVVRISAPTAGTAWDFSVSCPSSNEETLPPDAEISYGSIKAAIQKKGEPYRFFEEAYYLNLVGIRSPVRTVGLYDDMFCVLYKDDEGNEIMEKFEEFTTDPGPYYLEHFEKNSQKGCAIVVPGHYKSVWKNGPHRGMYDALIQIGNVISVYRDNNKDTIMDMEPSSIQTDWFGINLHHGGNSASVGMYSAGCQVFRYEADLKTVLALAQKQIDHGHGDSYSYTLLDESDLAGAPPTPDWTKALELAETKGKWLLTTKEQCTDQTNWEGGIERSESIAENDAQRITNDLLANIKRAAAELNLPVGLILGLASKESSMGAGLVTDATNPRVGFPIYDATNCGFGILQVDTGDETCTDTSKLDGYPNPTSYEHIKQGAQHLRNDIDFFNCECGSECNSNGAGLCPHLAGGPEWMTNCPWDDGWKLRAALVAYNAGRGSACTKEGLDQLAKKTDGVVDYWSCDYSSDVIARSQYYHRRYGT